MSDQSPEAQQEPRHDSDRLEEVRAWGDRRDKRAKELEAENAELKKEHRISGLRAAGFDPESYFGQTVLDAAEANGMTSAADVSSLARLIQSELQGRP